MLNPFNLYISILVSMGVCFNHPLDKTYPIKAPLLSSSNFIASSPFTSEYGIHSLAEGNHDISTFLEAATSQTYYKDGIFTMKAPYLVYVNESDRFYKAKVTNTVTGAITYEGNYDLWKEPYNSQPRTEQRRNIVMDGYYGDTLVNTISTSIDGNLNRNHECYYQNMRITPTSSLDNINNIRITFRSFNYAREMRTSEIEETRRIHLDGDSYTHNDIQEVTRFFNGSVYSYSYTYTLDDYYYVDSTDSTSTIPGVYYNHDITHDGNTWTIVHSFKPNVYGFYNAIFTSEDLIKRDGGYQDVTYKIEAPSEPSLDSFSSLMTAVYCTNTIDWFGDYFLKTINCSGTGDKNDKKLVESHWNEVETYYSNLPTSNKERIRNPSNNLDEALNEALARYDYIVFQKGYNVSDFLNRRSIVNHAYKGNIFTNLIEKDVNIVIIIICSSLSLLSFVILIVVFYKKKKTNPEE